MLLSVASAASGRLCVPQDTDISAGIGHITRAGRQDRSPLEPTSPNQPPLSKVSIMSQTQVAAPDYSPASPSFTRAAVRFVISFAALIGLSLLLAGL